jgi:hypothetical protein
MATAKKQETYKYLAVVNIYVHGVSAFGDNGF